MTDETRALLRTLPSLAGEPPALDLSALPEDPLDLFLAWLGEAVHAGVPEPHAMTLSTVSDDGVDARVLLLKDVDERGWAFASERSSAKGVQLAARPAAALTFWWQPLARSVRVRGPVVEAPPEESLADLRARPLEAQQRASPEDWTLWRVEASHVEFWQGSRDRRHVRVRYERAAGAGGHWTLAT
ncbi:MAG: pyridoxamine 5'-phosphate oxidase [Actinomycetales bacterium]|nr:pyridoxamine 5'-phosphate oxidase [Actinomycetales bacterium]